MPTVYLDCPIAGPPVAARTIVFDSLAFSGSAAVAPLYSHSEYDHQENVDEWHRHYTAKWEEWHRQAMGQFTPSPPSATASCANCDRVRDTVCYQRLFEARRDNNPRLTPKDVSPCGRYRRSDVYVDDTGGKASVAVVRAAREPKVAPPKPESLPESLSTCGHCANPGLSCTNYQKAYANKRGWLNIRLSLTPACPQFQR